MMVHDGEKGERTMYAAVFTFPKCDKPIRVLYKNVYLFRKRVMMVHDRVRVVCTMNVAVFTFPKCVQPIRVLSQKYAPFFQNVP